MEKLTAAQEELRTSRVKCCLIQLINMYRIVYCKELLSKKKQSKQTQSKVSTHNLHCVTLFVCVHASEEPLALCVTSFSLLIPHSLHVSAY